MPGATPIYGLPYPIGTYRLDAAVTTIPQSLATQLESTLQGFGGIAAPGAWNTPTLSANWSSYGSGFAPVAYRKVGAAVYLRGVLVRSVSASGAGATLFTLPVGFRPPANITFPMEAGGVFNIMTVRSDGAVVANNSVAAGGTLAFTSPPIWID